MANTNLIRTIVGVMGNVISFGLFMSPLPTFITIWKAKSVQDFKPDPYLVTILNCAFWSVYGMPFVTESNVPVITINTFGFVLEIVYTLIFLIYSTGSKRRKVSLILTGELIFIVITVFLILYFAPSPNQRKTIVGIICLVFNILMYFAPLTVMRRVIRTKSVKYMPLLLSLAGFANGIIWVIYSLLKWDPFIVFPNGLGALAGLAQLVLYAAYYRTTNWDEDTPSDV